MGGLLLWGEKREQGRMSMKKKKKKKKIEGEGGVGREGIWAGLSLSLSSLKEKIEMTRWGGSLSILASLSIYYLT